MTTSALDTPMMRQYLAVKAEHPDAVVFYRMGDFYEMFLADAELAAPLLDIALTTRDKNKPDPVPMCGVPVHAADAHIKRLAELGHRVAICEQVEDAKKAGGRRLVRREVVEVVTPGLVGDPAGLDGAREVCVAAVGLAGPLAGLAVLEASTGDFRATSATTTEGRGPLPELLVQELERISPRELLVGSGDAERVRAQLGERLAGTVVAELPGERFDAARIVDPPEGFHLVPDEAARRAASALLAYLEDNQPFACRQAPRLRPYALSDAMVLDAATRTHLELFENGEDRGRGGTLIEQVDRSVTALGARRLARWMAYPLLDVAAIRERQDAVAFLAERDRPRARLREAMRGVRDLERLLARCTRPGSVPRDLGQLRASLQALPEVAEALEGGDDDWLAAERTRPGGLRAPEPVPELVRLLEEALIDEPPVIARGSRGAGETGYIRAGYRSELDALRESAAKGREWIAGLEADERERSGIATLKVRYHPVHGYSLEVPKSQLSRVPGDYERRQTLANVERFTTEALREMEGRVLGAHERAAELERGLFDELREQVVAETRRIRAAADAVAELDALASLAETARLRGWARPEVDESSRLSITAGRHPVVEAMLERGTGDGFVANDAELDAQDAQILLLTGPNMSGKSTYLRQVALIVLLAQMGSCVPAEAARVGVVDRIFTRVGASDRLARGESTFMVEMRETAEILAQASSRSLIILDEIGRGTSTFDGLAIAWAVAEYLHDTPGLAARTLFATHYHELIDLALTKPRVRNAHFDARELDGRVVFLRRLVEGGASRSYGIQVARLAGLPRVVIDRAKQILGNLEGGELDARGRPRLARGAAEPEGGQLALALGGGAGPSPAERDVVAALRALDVDRTTPIEALQEVVRLQRILVEEEEA
jgi:DNA mismatch repair protein MutS